LLDERIPVVTANKTLLAHHGPALAARAQARNVPLRFEATVMAGVPFLGALTARPFAAGVQSICGVLNGTSHFTLEQLCENSHSLEGAIQLAQERGLAEPDPAADLDGRDAAEKLCVLLQAIGAAGVSPAQIETTGINAVTRSDLRQARQLGGAIKPVAFARRTAAEAVEAFVGPAFVRRHDPLALLRGAQNATRLEGPEIGSLLFGGPGAGPEVTAGTILDDVIEVSRGAPAPVRWSGTPIGTVSAPTTRWFVRLRFPRRETRFGSVLEFFEERRLGIEQLTGAPPESGGDRLHVILAPQPREVVQAALDAFASINPCDTLALRCLD
jgi:homoserine dehydrogenase